MAGAKQNRNLFYGEFTAQNVGTVATRLLLMLSGKLFTLVVVHQAREYKPETLLNQKLGGGFGEATIVSSSDPAPLIHINYMNHMGGRLTLMNLETHPVTFKFQTDYHGDHAHFSTYTPCGDIVHYNIVVEGEIPPQEPFTVTGQVGVTATVNDRYRALGLVAKVVDAHGTDVAYCGDYPAAELVADRLNAKMLLVPQKKRNRK